VIPVVVAENNILRAQIVSAPVEPPKPAILVPVKMVLAPPPYVPVPKTPVEPPKVKPSAPPMEEMKLAQPTTQYLSGFYEGDLWASWNPLAQFIPASLKRAMHQQVNNKHVLFLAHRVN
jgi:hypothetical protein